jgi:hypothetical protein
MEIVKARNSPRAKTNKGTYMSDEAFADLKQGLENALAFERGERQEPRVTRIERSRLKRQPRYSDPTNANPSSRTE